MKRFAFRALKIVALLGLCSVVWWVTRPRATAESALLQSDQLMRPELRMAADSAGTLLAEVVRSAGLPSLSVAVGVNGEEVWAATYGFSNVRSRTPASPETVYRIGSVSKSLTAITLMRQVDDNVLSLDQEITTLVPEFPTKAWPVTLRQLASHTGGIRHYRLWPHERGFFKENFFNGEHYESVAAALEVFDEAELLFEPGTQWHYSTHGYTLLSAAMAAAEQKPFPDLVADRLLKPLGLDQTYLNDVTIRRDDEAQLYVPFGGRYVRPRRFDPSFHWAGAGFLSTPRDLVRISAALLTDRWLSDSTRVAASTIQVLWDGTKNRRDYGLGWQIKREAELLGRADSTTVISHAGSTHGGSAFLLMVPESAITAAGATNMSLGDPTLFRETLHRIAGLFERALTDHPELGLAVDPVSH